MYPNLQKAIRLAVKWHEGQYRDGDHALPYITHPFDVMCRLRNVGGVVDEDLLCAAILHDTLEETGGDEKTIAKEINPRVAQLVEELTREEPDEKTRAALSEKEVYDLRNGLLLDEIAKMGPEAMQVKLADRLSNVIEAHRTRTGKKLERYLTQTDQILKIIPRKTNPALWDAVKKARKSG